MQRAEGTAHSSAQQGVFRSILSIDLRSLASMRIGLGLVILVDLILRSFDLVAHYTDAGALTNEFLIDRYGTGSYLSIHYWTGSNAALTAALFGVHALFAIGLIVGFRSRLMALACWVLGASLLKRNPALFTAGDASVMVLLFWSVFLPIGARCSVDAALNSDPEAEEQDRSDQLFSVAGAAILLQLCFVYWFAAGMKLHSPMWIDGSAVHNALHRDWVVDRAGIWLRQHESLLTPATYASLALELLGPFLVFLPRFTAQGRLLAVALFASLHLGFALSFHFGIFQWQSFVGWLVVLPACFWDRAGALTMTRARQGVRCYYDGDCGFCKKVLWIIREAAMLPRSCVFKAQDDPAIHEEMRRENSWVVIDHKGDHRHRWGALAYVLRRGPLTWPVGVITGLPGVRWVGDQAYRWIANHRDLLGWMIVWLRWRPVPVRPSLAMSVIAFWIIFYVFLLHVRTVVPPLKNLIPDAFGFPARALQLNDRWAMFTSVDVVDGWVILPARLADGSDIDLLTGEPVTREKPALISHHHGSMRWMKLTQNYAGLQMLPTENRWAPYGECFARRWDKAHPPERRVVRFEVRYMLEQHEGGAETYQEYHWATVDRDERR